MGFYTTEPAASRGGVLKKRAVSFFRGVRRPSPHSSRPKSPASTAFHAVVLRTTAPGVPLYGYRHYSPELGRWINRDPIGERAFFRQYTKGKSYVDRENLRSAALLPAYLFVENRPLSSIDQLGLSIFGSIWDFWEKRARNACCLLKIKASIDEDAIWAEAAGSEWGGIGYENGPEDAYRHCLGGCRLNQLMEGEPLCANTSFEKIVNRRERDDSHDMDRKNNLIGGNGPGSWGTCADYCSFQMRTGGLELRPQEEWKNRIGVL